jgi:hypothetical protein
VFVGIVVVGIVVEIVVLVVVVVVVSFGGSPWSVGRERGFLGGR